MEQMAATNADIARLFGELADLLEIEAANPFRVRAYRRAAQVVEGLPTALSDMVARGEDLTELESIGEDLAAKIKEIVETGGLGALEQERKNLPAGLVALLSVEGLGPKRARLLHDGLGVKDLAELKKAARAGRVAQLKGFGEKTQEKILKSLERVQARDERVVIHEVTPIAEALVAHLAAAGGGDVVAAGSLRRRKETVGDLDLLATAPSSERIMAAFVDHPDVETVVSRGSTRSTVRLRNGLQVDLRVVPAESRGAALHYFTGSKPHNIALRKRALVRGLKLNEYGVFDGDRRIAGATEDEVFAAVGLPYIPPELREAQGEIEAAEAGTLPRLVTVDDLRGDLHAHTTATDGHDTLGAMAKAAEKLGHEYIAITDHTPRATIANGMDAAGFKKQMKAIDRLNERLDGLTVLKGAEVDILKDGSLDLPDKVLSELDIVVCSLHFPGNLSRKEQTARICKAMSHPSAHILGHPSGRLLGKRDAYEVDMERLIDAAAEDGWAMEMNAQPKRLDLDDRTARLAKERGVKVAISTDAHRCVHLGRLRFAVDQARRGWLEKDDVLNTLPLARLQKALRR